MKSQRAGGLSLSTYLKEKKEKKIKSFFSCLPPVHPPYPPHPPCQPAAITEERTWLRTCFFNLVSLNRARRFRVSQRGAQRHTHE